MNKSGLSKEVTVLCTHEYHTLAKVKKLISLSRVWTYKYFRTKVKKIYIEKAKLKRLMFIVRTF